MFDWNKKYEKCISCSTTEWEYKAKGFCKNCYPILRSIERIKKWSLLDQNSLIEIPGVNKLLINQIIKENKFEKAKTEILIQLNNRLYQFKNCFVQDNVNGLNIEYLLNHFAEIILKEKGKTMFHGYAIGYDNNFSPEQMAKIKRDLSLILVKTRFTLNLTKILLNP